VDLPADFRILGPLEIATGSDRLDVGGARQEIVLAALLLNANRLVTFDELLEAIYGEDHPPTGRSQVQISISSLRRLFASRDDIVTISTRAHGYVIRLDGTRLDSYRFDEHVTAAQSARQAGQLEQAVACCRDALRLWRGPALDGIDSHVIRVAASRLDEQRITINEDRVGLELELGRHHELVGELTELVAKYPLRERLREHLMLALYRCDRPAEALQTYRDTRRGMLDELGIEPGKRLQQLEYDILNADPSLDPPTGQSSIRPAARSIPHMLPTDIADFTGRAGELTLIQEHLIRGAEDRFPPAVPVIVVVGKGGVGKTSLAVHAAHKMADHFADGQLFADLHGTTSHPVNPAHLLERFLRTLGLPGAQIPDGQDERAEMYRNMLASRKALVVLDDVSGEHQVRPLLPGSDAAAVIVTSRSRLACLAGAIHIEVDIFEADKSLQLLRRIAGAERVRAQSRAADAVARHCGHLPLALRIAGARLVAHPHWDMQQLVGRLADETRRLDELKHGDMHVRASISLGYESAGKDARRLFRRLALLDQPAFSGWVSAALIDRPLMETEHLLDNLVRAQLVEVAGSGSGAQSQYRFHELIRVFALERLSAEESPADRKAALDRALGALLYLAEQANRHHYGGDYLGLRNDAVRWPLPDGLVDQLVGEPLSWYERERAALISGIRQAAQAGLTELCWSLALNAVTLFESRVYLDDWQETHDIALETARRAGHTRGQAAMLYSIGSLNIARHRFDLARRVLDMAAHLFLDAGDDQGVALVTRHIAFIDRVSGRLDDAAQRYEQSLRVFRRHEDHMATAYALNGLAQVKLDLGDFGSAMDLLSEALTLSQAAPCGRVEAQVLYRIGEANLHAGKCTEAVGAFEAALARARDIGDPIGESYVLQGVGIGRLRLGMYSQAHDALLRAQELAAGVGERMAEARALAGLSELALASGKPAQALHLGQRASDAFGALGAVIHQARALRLVGNAHIGLGDQAAANTALAQATAISTTR
jgi:DNA-binding SARP family transcriptional activator